MGFGELLVILILVLVFFGAGRLPLIGEGLGKAIRGLKEAMRSEPTPARPEKKGPPPEGGAEK